MACHQGRAGCRMTTNGLDPRATAYCGKGKHSCKRNRQVVKIAQQYTYRGALHNHRQEKLPEGVRRVTGLLSCGHPFAVVVPLAFVAVMREWMPNRELNAYHNKCGGPMWPWTERPGYCLSCGEKVIEPAKDQAGRTAVRRDRGKLPAKQGPSGPGQRDSPPAPHFLAKRPAPPLGTGVRATPKRCPVPNKTMHPPQLEPAIVSAPPRRALGVGTQRRHRDAEMDQGLVPEITGQTKREW